MHPLSRRHLIALLSATGAHLTLTGCSGASTASTTAPVTPAQPASTNPQPTPSGTVNKTNVSVGSGVLGTVTAGYCGFSYEKSAIARRTLTTTSAGLVSLFKLLNTQSVLRVGGNSADSTVYTPAGKGTTLGQVSNADIDAFSTFAKAVNCPVIYGIALKGFFASPPTLTVANAVAEAVYAAGSLGSSLIAFEIGNEPDLYTTSTGTKITYAQFIAQWEPIATAIRAALPNVALSGPAIASTGNISTWSVPFASAEKSRGVTLLTQHRYVGDAASASSTDATLLADNTSSSLTNALQTLKTTAAGQSIAWRMSECGTYYDSAAGSQAMDFASALWVLDFLFTNVAYACQGVNIHSGGLPQYSAFVPISDDEVNTVTAVNALYYGMLLFSLGGTGTALLTTSSAPVTSSAYTVQTGASQFSTWIINKDTTASQSLQVTLTLPGNVKSATLKVMQGTALSAHTGTMLQGATVGVNGTFTPAADYTLTVSANTVTCYVPFNAAVLVQSVLS